MIIPVRCFGCGKPIGHLGEEYKKRVESGEEPKKVLEDLKVERYCCRAVLLGQSELLSEVTRFKKA